MAAYIIYFIILSIAEIVASLSVGYWMPYVVLDMINHEKSAKIYLLNFICAILLVMVCKYICHKYY